MLFWPSLARPHSYETTTPYAPFVDLFTTTFGLRPDQPDEVKYELIFEYIAAIAPQRAIEIAPYLATMLGIQLSGECFHLFIGSSQIVAQFNIVFEYLDLFRRVIGCGLDRL